MNIVYNNQEKIATNIKQFLLKVFGNFRKTQLNIIPYIVIGMILSESIVASDIAKNLKDDFSLIKQNSVIRRIRRFFSNKLFDPYSFYETIIKYVISTYRKKHFDKRVHIIFDHMYSKDNYTILMFSLRIGNQGIPLYFRCFDGINNPLAFFDDTIIEGINTVFSYFKDYDFDLIFLADRWFNTPKVISAINNINATYVIRLKGNTIVRIKDKDSNYIKKTASELFAYQCHANYYENALLYDNNSIKTNIAIGKKEGFNDHYIIITNGDVKRAIKDYGYRFGGIETIFKNQKSNGFYLENVSNASIKSFTSMYSILCFSVLFLTLYGIDYAKNHNKHYKNVQLTTHKNYKNGGKKRVMSFFNTGLTLFHIGYCSTRYVRMPFTFRLIDV